MLTPLIDALKHAMTVRNLDVKRLARLLVEAKHINYSTLKIPENVEEIENALENTGLFDMLWTLRTYLVTYTVFELKVDWYTVVDTVEAATGCPISAETTVNQDTKEEYYRIHTPTPKQYIESHHPGYAERNTSLSLFRGNDYLAVLWLLSWVDAHYVEQLKASAPPTPAKEPVA